MSEPPAGRPWGRLRWPSAFVWAAILTAAWALLANFARLGFPSEGFDEPYYAEAAWRYVHGDTGVPPTDATSNFDNFEHPPLAKYLFGLAQLVAGEPSIVADRVVAVLCTLATAAVLGVWLGSVAGRWVGLGAAGLVALLPMSVPNLPFRFGRYGYLDPVAELFAVTSVVLAWVWFHRSGRPAWGYAVATGACVGLAAASKENGFLGVIGPVLVGIALSGRDLRAVGVRALQATVAAATSVLVFATTYLGFEHPYAAFEFMLRHQQQHADEGHRVEFAGRVTEHPPGWAFLWFAEQGIGTVVSVVCLIAVAAAILLRRDRLVLWCVAALAVPVLFHTVVAPVVLSFYWVMWMPAFLALVALGVDALARVALDRVGHGQGNRVVAGVVAAICVAVLAGSSVVDTHRMLTEASAEDQTAYSSEVLSHGPLVYLRLGESAGVSAIDASGHKRDGRYVNVPSLRAEGLVTGDAPLAVELNGLNQYVGIGGASWMDVPDYSVAFWFSGTATDRYLVSRDDYIPTKVWDVLVDETGRVQFLTYGWATGAGQRAISPEPYNDGRPHMVVATKSGTEMELFVDGALVASEEFDTFVQGSQTPDIEIGRRGNATGHYDGILDEFAFFGEPLSDGDVLELYRAGRHS